MIRLRAGKRHRSAPRAERRLAEQHAGRRHLVPQLPVRPRVDDVEPGAHDPDRRRRRRRRARRGGRRRRCRAARPGHDRDAGRGELGAEPAGDVPAVAAAPAGADDGHPRPGEHVGTAPGEQHRRRLGVAGEGVGPARAVAGEHGDAGGQVRVPQGVDVEDRRPPTATASTSAARIGPAHGRGEGGVDRRAGRRRASSKASPGRPPGEQGRQPGRPDVRGGSRQGDERTPRPASPPARRRHPAARRSVSTRGWRRARARATCSAASTGPARRRGRRGCGRRPGPARGRGPTAGPRRSPAPSSPAASSPGHRPLVEAGGVEVGVGAHAPLGGQLAGGRRPARRTAAVASPGGPPSSWPASGRATSTRRSKRSSSGPDRRRR